MNILFLTPQLPYPPQKGTALRNWGLIAGLARRHQVSLLSFLAPGQDPHPAPPLAAACARLETVPQPVRPFSRRLRDLALTRQPDMALRLASEEYAQRLADWLAREIFDVVHVEGIELAPYLDVIEETPLRRLQDVPPTERFSADEDAFDLRNVAKPSQGFTRPLVIFDDHNCEYLLQKRTFLTDLRGPTRWPGAAYSFVQWQRLRRYEAHVCRRADRVLAVSDADAAALQSLVPGLAVTVIPNGIDTQTYTPTPPHSHTPTPPHPHTPTLVFTGTMDFRPNVDAVLWFAQRVLPRVRAELPGVHFVVVGQRPHRRLDPLREDPVVKLTGWVEDTRPYIAQAAVYVAPLRMGGGTRLKLLEAMAMGKAVVATRLGAEGYPVTDGRELLLADTPADFAAVVVALLRAPERRAELGRAARTFVEQRYDWRVIVPRVEAVYEANPKPQAATS
ncbi:MAG: glycosyltransferase [Anaerolineae bacterium]|nr:glycosyltransferase [Anaerolineae bacterium]